MVIGRARPLQRCNHVATHRERALPRIIAVSGSQWYVHRDAWYAQLVLPQYALAQIVNPALVPRPNALPAAAFSY
jgi:hypothetical protein